MGKKKVEKISLLKMGTVWIQTFTGNTNLKQRKLCPERQHVGGGGDIKHVGLFSRYDQLHYDFWNDKRKVCSLDLTTFSITKLSRHLAMCLYSVHIKVDDTWPLQLHGYYSKLVFKTPVSRPKARHSDMKGLEIFPISWAACGTDFAMFYGIGRKYFFIERMIFPGGQVWPPPFPW